MTYKIHHMDFMDNDLPDKCANLIIADPPYFEVKGEFDFVWGGFDDYLKDVERWAMECKRILADNGTLFWWGGARRIAYTQVLLDKHFRLLNNLVWEKNECQTMRAEIDAMRRFAPITERLLMYDLGEDKSGLASIFDDPALFIPIKKYFDDWLDKSGMTLKEAVGRIGSSCSHWFGFTIREKTQFAFPTKEKWDKMQEIFPDAQSYEELRASYEELRRPFNPQSLISDVLKFSQESHITMNYSHDTVKPETLTRLLIQVCSNRDDLVVVPFAGSGTECAMAIKEGREAIGYEINKDYVDMAERRCKLVSMEQTLF